MERTTDEMAATLSKLLGTMEKTAAKHDEAEDHGKDHEEKAEDKAEDKKKEQKTKDHKKKAAVFANVVNTLVKLADDFDSSGDMEASDLVDSALSIIMENVDGAVSKSAMFHDLEEDDGDLYEYVPGEDSGEDLGMMDEMEDMLQSKLESMSPDERKAFQRWLETGHRD